MHFHDKSHAEFACRSYEPLLISELEISADPPKSQSLQQLFSPTFYFALARHRIGLSHPLATPHWIVVMNRIFSRAGVFLLGLLISCTAYCLTVRADIGLGPLFLVQVALEGNLGLSAGTAAMVIGLVLVALSAIVRGGVGIGTLLAPILGGIIIDLALPLTPTVHGLPLQIAACAVGTVVMMLGGAFITQANFGVGGMDGLMRGLSRKTDAPLGHVRLAMEATLLICGLLLGSEAGIGTLITALLVGHSYQFWVRLLSQQRILLPAGAPTAARQQAVTALAN